ncbi:25110_t:CDS:2, partial [Dentiscutata erythropus]
MSSKKVMLTDMQKAALCIYAHDNKMTRAKYVDWIEQQWGVRIDESMVSRILKTRVHVELSIRTILSNAILIQKVKLLAAGLGVPEGTLQFSSTSGEAASVDNDAITSALPLLRSKCASYPLHRIYNIDEARLFYCLELDRTLATYCIARCKEEVSTETIRNCWRHTKILSVSSNVDLRNLSENICQVIDSEIDDLAALIENLHFLDPMQRLLKFFKKNGNLDETKKMDDSSEIPIVSADLALESLETVYMYLLQQDNT